MTTMDPEIEVLREEIKKKTGKTPEELYDERETRIQKAARCEKPDRVPIVVLGGPTEFTKDIPHSAAYYDPVTVKKASRQVTLALDCDAGTSLMGSSGKAMELLDVKRRLWPGGPLPPDYEAQAIEGEYMKEDEYDLFFEDQTDFILRHYLPRVYGVMEPMKKLPYAGYNFNYIEMIVGMLDSPEFIDMAKRLVEAGRESKKFREKIGNTIEEITQLGYPQLTHFGPAGGAPFDTVSSSLRGMYGAMTDMYRQPENLLKLCDVIQEKRLANIRPAEPTERGSQRRLGMPLWRGDKSFMSQKHFEKFYWPGLKKQLLTLIEFGYIPMPFFEDEFGDRLECMLELPRAKAMALIDSTDVLQMSKKLKGHTCILSGGPHSQMYSSLQEVEDYNKRLMDECAPDGGFILISRLPINEKIENIQAMMERLKEYGKY